MTDNNLTDVWRNLNPGVKRFSWFKPNGGSKYRIDYWLVSDDVLRTVAKSEMTKASLLYSFNFRTYNTKKSK